MSDYKDGYSNPGVDRSFGTHSSEGAISTTKYVRTTARVSTPTPDGLVSVAGVKTTRAAAEAAGLLVPTESPIGPPAVRTEFTPEAKAHEVSHQREVAQQSREAAAEQQVYDDFNLAYDNLSAVLGEDNLGDYADAVIAGDEDAIAVLPPEIENGYRHVAQQIAQRNGLNNLDAMNIVLSDDDRVRALNALVSNNEREFSKYVQKTLNEARSLCHEPWFQEEIENAGGKIRGSNLIIDGKVYDVGHAILSGMVRFDD